MADLICAYSSNTITSSPLEFASQLLDQSCSHFDGRLLSVQVDFDLRRLFHQDFERRFQVSHFFVDCLEEAF